MSDRIKLAEAMGLITSHDAELLQRAIKHHTHFDLRGLPDPFTDANDDYAVLEWMRKTFNEGQLFIAAEYLRYFETGMPGYQIGDYARAASKILEAK